VERKWSGCGAGVERRWRGSLTEHDHNGGKKGELVQTNSLALTKRTNIFAATHLAAPHAQRCSHELAAALQMLFNQHDTLEVERARVGLGNEPCDE